MQYESKNKSTITIETEGQRFEFELDEFSIDINQEMLEDEIQNTINTKYVNYTAGDRFINIFGVKRNKKRV